MSILATKNTHVVVQGGAAGVNAARRMAEFRYMIKQPLNVSAFVYPPDAGKTNEVICGTDLVTIPVYKSVAEATATHPEINTSLVYIGADRAFAGAKEALNMPVHQQFRQFAILAFQGIYDRVVLFKGSFWSRGFAAGLAAKETQQVIEFATQYVEQASIAAQLHDQVGYQVR